MPVAGVSSWFFSRTYAAASEKSRPGRVIHSSTPARNNYSWEITATRANSRSRWACSSGRAIVKTFISLIVLYSSQIPLNVRSVRAELSTGEGDTVW